MQQRPQYTTTSIKATAHKITQSHSDSWRNLSTKVLTKWKESFKEWYSLFLCVFFSTWCWRNSSKMRHSNSFSKTNRSSAKNSEMTSSCLRLSSTSAALKTLKFPNTCVVSFLLKYHDKPTHFWSTKWISTSSTWSFTSWTSTSSLKSVLSRISYSKNIKFPVWWLLTPRRAVWVNSKKNWILAELKSSMLKVGKRQFRSRKAKQILSKHLRKKRILTWFQLRSLCHSWIKTWLKTSKLSLGNKLSFKGMPCQASVQLHCCSVTDKSTLPAWVILGSWWRVVSRIQQ